MMTARISDTDSREDIMKVFRLFDDDETGFISINNLQRVARELGEQMTPVRERDERRGGEMSEWINWGLQTRPYASNCTMIINSKSHPACSYSHPQPRAHLHMYMFLSSFVSTAPHPCYPAHVLSCLLHVSLSG